MVEHLRIGGLAIQYYFSCKRELWLYLNYIDPDQEDIGIVAGRILHKKSYRNRGRKEIDLGMAKVDLLRGGEYPRIIEIKKSTKLIEPAIWQLKFYLWILKKQGTIISGEVRIPKENKIIRVQLTSKDEAMLQKAIDEMPKIARIKWMPPYEKKPYCKGCAYRQFCEV